MRALLIDDDPWALRLLSVHFLERLPGVELTLRQSADLSGDYDIYCLANDIAGEATALQAVREARAANPRALVIVLSASITREELKRLTHMGCDGVFDKGDEADRDAMLDILTRYRAAARGPRKRFGGAVSAIRGLLSEWNRRLDAEDAASAQEAS